MTLSIGIDIGTSGIRTATVDSTGKVLSTSHQQHLPQNLDKINPELWWQSVKAGINSNILNLKEKGINPLEISSLAVDGTSGSMLLTDSSLQPVTRALMYNSAGFDPEAEIIAKIAPEPNITRGSNSALARAMRLISEDEDNKARHLMHQADFIAAKLMKKGGLSDQNNTLKLGYDPKNECWPEWIINSGFNHNLLPDVYPIGKPLGTINNAIAVDLRLSKNLIIHAGTTDSIAGFLASAPLQKGAAVTSLGSTLAIKILCKNQIKEPSIGLYSHKIGNFWLTGGASNTGGTVLKKYFTKKEIVNLSSKIDPNMVSGLEYYPLAIPGERFPVNNPNLQPCLTPRPTKDSIFLQGMFEGMARIEKNCYTVILDRGGDFPKYVLTVGGGANNSVWTTIRSKILGVNVTPGVNTEAAVGAAKIPILFKD